MNQIANLPVNRAEKVGVSLFPEHIRIVSTFGSESHRTFSNAVQFIIEDWERMKRAALQSAEPQPEAV